MKSAEPKSKQDKVSPKPKQAQKKKQLFAGLCVNCEKRFTCLHYNQIGGVWYCEEYE